MSQWCSQKGTILRQRIISPPFFQLNYRSKSNGWSVQFQSRAAYQDFTTLSIEPQRSPLLS